MKKLLSLLCFIILSIFFMPNVYAEEINIKSINVKDKSGTILVDDLVLENNSITSNITFNQINDFVTFDVEVENNNSGPFALESITSNIDSNILSFESNYGKIIKGNSTEHFDITVMYNEELINIEEESINNLSLSLNFSNKESLINPPTGNYFKMFFYLIGTITVGLLIIKVLKKKHFKLFILLLLLVPFAVKGEEGKVVSLGFNNITVKGRLLEYSIVVEDENGNIEVINKTYGTRIGDLNAPNKDGYSFLNWYDKNSNEDISEDSIIQSDMHIAPKFEVITYNITYDLNGGSLSTTNPSTYNIETNDFTLNNPTKVGYTFSGWSIGDSEDLITSLTIFKGSIGNKSITAHFSPNQDTSYTVIHRKMNIDGNGYSVEETEELHGATDSNVTPQRKDYTGFTAPEAQTKTINGNGTTTFTYDYTRNQYTFSVLDRTYVEGTEDGTYYYGVTITVTAQARAGYDFLWNDGVTTFTNTFIISSDKVLSADYTARTDTIYKVYHRQQELSLDSYYQIISTYRGRTGDSVTPPVNSYNGFTSPSPQTVTINGDGSTEVIYYYTRNKYQLTLTDSENITTTTPSGEYYYETEITLTAKTRNNYTFSGWSDGNTSNPYTFTLTGNKTIGPEYSRNKITITLDPDGGEVSPTSIEVDQGAPVGELPTPTKGEYIFDGWWTAKTGGGKVVPTSMLSSSITLIAHYISPCRTFETDSWSTIVSNLKTNPSYYSATFNCTKEVEMDMDNDGTNESYTVRLSNTSTPEVCAVEGYSQTACGTVIEFVDIPVSRGVNSTSTTVGGWKASEMATWINNDFYNKLPSDLRSVIIPTYPIVSGSGDDGVSDNITDIDTTINKLYLLSTRETGFNSAGDNKKNVETDTRTLDYYYGSNNNVLSRVKYDSNNTAKTWWLRTAQSTSTSNYYHIQTSGYVSITGAHTSYGVAPAFRIGEKVTITFNANGGTSQFASKDIVKGYNIGTLPTVTPPAGNNFLGWYTGLTNGDLVTTSYTPTTNETLYARYSVQSFTVSFDTNGGSAVASQTIDYGEHATRPTTNPEKTGLIFDNWYTDDTYTTVFDFTNTTITENTTIYAHFISPCRTFETDSWSTIVSNLKTNPSYYSATANCQKEVEMDMNNDGTNESYTVRLSNTSTPAVCSVEGYSQTACGTVIEFVDIVTDHAMNLTQTNVGGWKSSDMVTYLNNDIYNKLPSDLKNVITPTYPIVSGSGKNSASEDISETDTTLNKLYLLSTREVGLSTIYDNNKDGYIDTKVLDYYNINNNNSSRIKYDSLNVSNKWWLRSAANLNDSYFLYVDSTGDYKFYFSSASYGVAPAFRIGEKVTVTFNAGDGSTTISSKDIVKGDKIGTLPTPTPPTGYDFDGWYTASTDGEKVLSTSVPTSNMTIYARYTIKTFNVSFNTDGGSSIDSLTVDYNGHATRPATDPTKTGLQFDNWYTDDTYTTLFDFENTQITSTTTIYAHFINPCKTFATDSWSTIVTNLKNDSNYYSATFNCTKEVEMDMDEDGTNESYTVRLSNTSTPSVCSTPGYSQTACGTVIEFVDAVSEYSMNSEVINVGGWKATSMVTYLNSDFYNKLPSDLRNVIIPTYPIVSGSGSGNDSDDITDIDSTINRIYLLSTREVGSNSNNDNKNNEETDTRTLDYYNLNNNNESRIKYDMTDSSRAWHLRTASSHDAWNYYCVTDSGYADDSWGCAFKGFRVTTPAFRIGEKVSVTFNANGGTSTFDSKDIVKGDGLGTLPEITPEAGFTFDGWYTALTNGEKVTSSYVPSTDITLFARYINTCDSFATDSWSTIVSNIKNDPNYYSVANSCTKEVEMDMDEDGTNESYTVRLANTSTPSVCSTFGYSQTACGTVIEFVDIVTNRRMNSTDTNAGGWKATEMVTWLNSDFYNKLPSDLRNVIIPTYPIVSGSNSGETLSNVTDFDSNKNKIYLLSVKELGGNATNNDNSVNKTRVLDYYESNNNNDSRIKYDLSETASTWWLRSASSKYNNHYLYTNASGNFSSSSVPTYVKGIVPVFRIGEKITVTFNANGGTSTLDSKDIVKGDGLGTLPEVTPDAGFIFDGWYTALTNGEKVTSSYVLNADITLFAKYINTCDSFATDSWSTIVSNISSNPNYYSVANNCTKEVEMDMDNDGTNESYTVRLSNTSTPSVCSTSGYSQTACGTVIEFVDIVTNHVMNSGVSNVGGWKASDMVTWLNSDFYNKLPSDLTNVIISTYPIVSGSGSNNDSDNIVDTDTTKNKLYFLSSREVGLNSTYDNKNNVSTDTRVLDYYNLNNTDESRIKYDLTNTAKYWWLRTACSDASYAFYSISYVGNTGYTFTSSSYGVSPAFRIGNNS